MRPLLLLKVFAQQAQRGWSLAPSPLHGGARLLLLLLLLYFCVLPSEQHRRIVALLKAFLRLRARGLLLLLHISAARAGALVAQIVVDQSLVRLRLWLVTRPSRLSHRHAGMHKLQALIPSQVI